LQDSLKKIKDNNVKTLLVQNISSELEQLRNHQKPEQAFKYLSDDSIDILKIWKYIVEETLDQEFYLGIKFDEPSILKIDFSSSDNASINIKTKKTC